MPGGRVADDDVLDHRAVSRFEDVEREGVTGQDHAAEREHGQRRVGGHLLHCATVASVANTEARLRIALILKECTLNHDHRPNLAHDPNILGNVDGLGDDICTVIKVQDLVGSH